MNDEQIRKIIDDTYDESREDTIGSMLRDFYNRRMLSVAIFIWAWALVITAVTIFSAVKFFNVDQTRDHIMYASIFICGCLFISIMKIFAWQMIHRNNIKREIKRLELRIAALGEALKEK